MSIDKSQRGNVVVFCKQYVFFVTSNKTMKIEKRQIKFLNEIEVNDGKLF